MVVGVGGEHSVTDPLVRAAAGQDDLSGVTVVQIDAHADLRDRFENTEHSHACVARRILERGAHVIAIGIRSAERSEFEYGHSTGRWSVFSARELSTTGDTERMLLDRWRSVEGKVYLTIDVDGLDLPYSPATGTPEPGGGQWYPTLRMLRRVFEERTVLALDVVEHAPIPGLKAPDFLVAKLVYKMIAYWELGAPGPRTRAEDP